MFQFLRALPAAVRRRAAGRVNQQNPADFA